MQNYKVLHEAKDHFVLHDAQDGRQFKVPKKSLSEKNYQMVKQLPVQKAYDGGEVSDPSQFTPQIVSDLPQTLDPQPQVGPTTGGASGSFDTPVNMGGASGTFDDPSTPASAPQPASTSPTSLQVPITAPLTMTPGLGLQQQGVREDVKAKTDLGNTVGGIQDKLVADQQSQDATFNASRQALDSQTEKLYNDTLNEKIDPTHFWSSKSTANQIGSAIAIVLGGLGGGVSGKGGNAAMDVINKAIDNDIASQKANLDNKRSLLSVNLQRTNNLDQAYSMTKSQLYALAGAQVSSAQAKAMGPEAKAQGDQLLGQLKNAAQVQNAQIAQLALFRQKLAAGQKPDAIDAVNAGIIPKEFQQQAYKEQASIEAKNKAIQSANDLFDKLNMEQTTGNLANPQSYARVQALRSDLVNAVMSVSPAKRLTRETAEQEIDPILTKTLNDQSTREVQRQSLNNMIDRHADPTPLMNHYNLTPKKLTPTRVN